jgi:inner membrane protein
LLIAHLPAAYLAAKGARAVGGDRTLAVGIVLGGILPDLDMLWFHFVDGGSVHHHEYLTHRPILWLAVLALGLVLRKAFLSGIGIGGLLHMALDTIAGAIVWGWPVWSEPTTLVVVPATRAHWVASFLAHWTIRVEIAICVAAAVLFAVAWRKGRVL